MEDLTFDLSTTKDIVEELPLTKEFILQKVSEETIFEHYGVPIKKGLFCSKLRSDKRPTVGLYRNSKGRLILHDFGDGTYHDCFSYVMALFNISYYMALQVIANDFGIINRRDLKVHKAKITATGTKFEERKSSSIQIQTREFNQRELNWWGNYGITHNTLTLFRVYPVDTVWLNNNLFYNNISNQPVFGYFGGIDKDKNELWRIYWPNRKIARFISNWKSTYIQGVNMLPKEGDYIIITKALKDVMCFYEFGIPAIAPCSENLFLTEAQYKQIETRFKKIFVLYDADLPGVRAVKKIKRNFPNVQILLLPWGTAKDFSDYRKKYGYKKTLDLVNQAKEYYG